MSEFGRTHEQVLGKNNRGQKIGINYVNTDYYRAKTELEKFLLSLGEEGKEALANLYIIAPSLKLPTGTEPDWFAGGFVNLPMGT